MSILCCEKASLDIKNKIKERISSFNIDRKPTLAVINISDNKSSDSYAKGRKEDCKYCGIDYIEYNLNKDIDQISLLNLIYSLNEDDDISGILIDMPIPNHLDRNFISSKISCFKDVDAMNQNNLSYLLFGEKNCFYPCTPLGVVKLLDYYDIDICGKHCVVLGRSLTVGKPLSLILLNKDASVSICHSKSKNISEITKTADILISCVGRPNFVTSDMIKNDSIVIDIGVNYSNGKICGDVDFENVSKKAKFITKVPKGMGLMTRACLMDNIVAAFQRINNI